MFRVGASTGIRIYVQGIDTIIRDKSSERESQLTHIVGALNSLRSGFDPRHCRQQKRGHDCDDGDDHQQLNQGETVTIRSSHIDWTVPLVDGHE
jgi:hypothetical protein